MRQHTFVAIVAFVVAFSILACQVQDFVPVSGAGNVVTQQMPITGFDKVAVSDAFHVDIRQSDSFRVVIRVNEDLIQHLQATKEGNTLKIGLKGGYSISAATLQAEVSMPDLAGLEVSNASHVTVSGFKSTKSLNVAVSGASYLTGDIKTGDSRFDIADASQVTLKGSGQDVTIDARGASQVNLADFSVVNATIKASGASQVTVNLSGKLNANASGASEVYYLGSPTLGTIDATGASKVKRK